MAIIAPCITAENKETYDIQMNRVAPFAKRVHIDLADGVFTPNTLISLDEIWWPIGVQADLHLMYKAVMPYMKQLLAHKPHMVIVQAEATGSYFEVAERLHAFGIKVGVSLLGETAVDVIKPALAHIDHVLIFSGDLGYFGGHAKLEYLKKAEEIKRLSPAIEIGWDGGVAPANVHTLILGGVDVFNAGGAIQNAQNPQKAYDTLVTNMKESL